VNREDPLSPVQGILLGAAIGLAFWIVSIGAIWWVKR